MEIRCVTPTCGDVQAFVIWEGFSFCEECLEGTHEIPRRLRADCADILYEEGSLRDTCFMDDEEIPRDVHERIWRSIIAVYQWPAPFRGFAKHIHYRWMKPLEVAREKRRQEKYGDIDVTV